MLRTPGDEQSLCLLYARRLIEIIKYVIDIITTSTATASVLSLKMVLIVVVVTFVFVQISNYQFH